MEGAFAGDARVLAGAACKLNRAIDHWRLERRKRELQREAIGDRLKALGVTLPASLPVPVTDPGLCQVGTCEAWAGSIQTLKVKILSCVNVAQRQVCKVDVVHVPVGSPRLAGDSLAKEGQLEAETMAIRRLEIAGVVELVRPLHVVINFLI